MQGLICTISEWKQQAADALVERLREEFPQAEPAQVRSWQSLIRDLQTSLTEVPLPDHCVLAVEYTLPTDGMAIDLLLAGLDARGEPVAYITEAKQWDDRWIADTQFSAYREPDTQLHPQVQVSRHRLSFCHYLDIGPKFQVSPSVYLPNASRAAAAALAAENPIPSCRGIPIFHRMGDLLSQASRQISAGDPAIAEQLRRAAFTPSLGIISAMSAVVTREESFLLTPEQQGAAAAVMEHIAAGKKIIRITGAAGAGKTAILLNLYVRYLNESSAARIHPIFVPGAQTTNYYRRTYFQVANSFTYSFSLERDIQAARNWRHIVFMDEAQHNQPGIISRVAALGATLVLCYDVTQILYPDNARAELRLLERREDFVTIPLHGSIRFNNSQVAEGNIRTFLRGGTQFQEDPLFEFRVFTDFSAFQGKVLDTIVRYPDRSMAVAGLLCSDADRYTRAGDPNSRFFTDWGYKTECQWVPYVLGKNYLSQFGGDLWVGTWWMPGLDFDYVAVIAGGDAVITPDGFVGVPDKSKHYRMMVGVARELGLPAELIQLHRNGSIDYFNSFQTLAAFLDRPENEAVRRRFVQRFSQYLRNTYYVMMTRGRKGCFVFFANQQVLPAPAPPATTGEPLGAP